LYIKKGGEIVGTEAEFDVPTWNQIYAMLLSLAEKIRKDGFKPDVIVGVTRGGWIPARVLSDLLEISNLATVGVEFYVGCGETRNAPILTQHVSKDVGGKKTLLVDDVADTGKSLQLAREHLQQQGAKEVRVATVYFKPFSLTKPDYFEEETRCWVVFPWDIKETILKITKKRQDTSGTTITTEKLVRAGVPKQLIEEFLKEVHEAEKC
jgi:hypoxanthine phosphoribosyltransferase